MSAMTIPTPKAVAGPVEMDAGLRAAGRDPGHPGAGMAGHFDSRRGNPVRRVPAGDAVAALSSTCTTRWRTSRPSLTCTRRCAGAGLAERYAVAAVDFALAATDEAEYAALDAILAWADADATHSRRVQA